MVAHRRQKPAQNAHTVTASLVLAIAYGSRGGGAPFSSFQAYHISAQEWGPVGTPLLTKFLIWHGMIVIIGSGSNQQARGQQRRGQTYS